MSDPTLHISPCHACNVLPEHSTTRAGLHQVSCPYCEIQGEGDTESESIESWEQANAEAAGAACEAQPRFYVTMPTPGLFYVKDSHVVFNGSAMIVGTYSLQSDAEHRRDFENARYNPETRTTTIKEGSAR